MSLQEIDDAVHAIELGIDADEEELGITAGRLIQWKRMAIVVLETDDGIFGVGYALQKRTDVLGASRGLARARAIESVKKVRAKRELPR